MPRLFASHHLSRDRIERALQRPLSGDASRGELALFYKLGSDRLVDVRDALARPGPELKPDFVDYMRKHLEAAEAPTDRPRQWTVQLPVHISQHYVERAAASRASVGTILEEAILRDFQAAKEARSLVEELVDAVRAANTSVTTVRQDLQGVLTNVGNLADITRRIGLIETVLKDWSRTSTTTRR